VFKNPHAIVCRIAKHESKGLRSHTLYYSFETTCNAMKSLVHTTETVLTVHHIIYTPLTLLYANQSQSQKKPLSPCILFNLKVHS